MSPDPGAGVGEVGLRGYATLAVGGRAWLEMAVDVALSLRERDDLGIALVADAPLAEAARADFPGVFDHVRELGRRYVHRRAVKYGVAEASPWERTLYLDADCLVVEDLAPVWEGVEGAELAFAGEVVGPGEARTHHGFPTPLLIEHFGLERYLKTNSGVFYFRRAAGLAFMEACLACYRDEVLPGLRGGFLGDEIAIGVVGGRRGAGTFPPPGPMWWPGELAGLDLDRPRKPVVHFIGPLPRGALDALMDGVERRRREAGLPAGSSAHWRRKHARSARGRVLTRIARPFLPLARVLGIGTTRNL